MPIFFVFGAHAFIWGTTSITVRQRAVPTHLQGRVNSVNTISVFGGLVVGSAIGGALATHYGVTAPFWFAFVGSAVFVVLLWRELTRIAHTDQQPHPDSAVGNSDVAVAVGTVADTNRAEDADRTDDSGNSSSGDSHNGNSGNGKIRRPDETVISASN